MFPLGLSSNVILALSLIATFSVYVIYVCCDHFFIRPWKSALRNLQGPPNQSFLWGNRKQIMAQNPGVVQEAWEEEYGHVYSFRTPFSARRLFTTDPRSISHVLNHTIEYPKNDSMRQAVAGTLGDAGLFLSGGETHKRQRKIMDPSFGTPQIRELLPIFFEKASLLCDKLLQHVAVSSAKAGFITDILPWLSHTTLDIIGQAGFDYQFRTLERSEENEFSVAIKEVLREAEDVTVLKIVKYLLPIFRFIPDLGEGARNAKAAMRIMIRIGTQLVDDKKTAVLQHIEEVGTVKQAHVMGRDLLSTIIRANMSADLDPTQRLSDEEVLAQISTFLVAGHETTATALTWCLYALSAHPSVQARLHSEVLNAPSDGLSMEELNALPYLDCVVRESLRLLPPVPYTSRVASADGVIPVSEPYVDRWGKLQKTIRVTTGDIIDIPMLVLARSKKIWGNDAHEFKPERWEAPLPDSVHDMPSIWSNIPSFISGPRACIGHKFAIIEMKAILFTLLRNIDFELADPSLTIGQKLVIVTRPFLESEPEKGFQLPLRLKAL